LIENELMIRMNNHENVMSSFQFFNVQLDVVAHFIKVHVVIDMKDQTKSRFATHDYLRLVHQSFDQHINFCFWIHQFDDSNNAFNDNFCFEKFTRISLFFFFLRDRSRSDQINVKLDDIFFKKDLENNLLNKLNKDDNLDLSTF
jgi:hypothetical protein